MDKKRDTSEINPGGEVANVLNIYLSDNIASIDLEKKP
jgi:hypothetical protein